MAYPIVLRFLAKRAARKVGTEAAKRAAAETAGAIREHRIPTGEPEEYGVWFL